jgi:hypothetical protein
MNMRERLSAAEARASHWEEIARSQKVYGDTEKEKWWMRALKAEDFIRHLGFRRCDIPACNCGSWHKWEVSDAKEEGL